MQQKNLVLFLVLSMFILVGIIALQHLLQKPQPPAPASAATITWPWDKQPRDAIPNVARQSISRLIAAGALNGNSDPLCHLATEVALTYERPDMRPVSPPQTAKKPDDKTVQEPAIPAVTSGTLPRDNVAAQLVAYDNHPLAKLLWCANYFWGKPPHGPILLGDDEGKTSKFNLHVVLLPTGAGVQEIVLNRFQEADKDGLPVYEDPRTQKQPKPLHLVPASEPIAYLLYHFADPGNSQPENTLATTAWDVVAEKHEGDEDRVVFRKEVGDVIVTKTYTLKTGDYHIGLEIGLQLKPGAAARKFRYQLTSAHGLPVEGQWYTYTFRNAIIEKSEGGNPWRTLTAARDITHDGGQDASWRSESGWIAEDNKKIDFFGISVQYFASMMAVEKPQADDDFPGKRPACYRKKPYQRLHQAQEHRVG